MSNRNLLQFSGANLKELTGWPDSVVEDYLQIVDALNRAEPSSPSTSAANDDSADITTAGSLNLIVMPVSIPDPTFTITLNQQAVNGEFLKVKNETAFDVLVRVVAGGPTVFTLAAGTVTTILFFREISEWHTFS
jgi:hypothetical protein